MDLLVWMKIAIEKLVIYSSVALFCPVDTSYLFMGSEKRFAKSIRQNNQSERAWFCSNLFPLHPVIDPNTCIKSGACITSCPEQDILGIRNGIATTINASNCVGHGACFHACPVEAISLVYRN